MQSTYAFARQARRPAFDSVTTVPTFLPEGSRYAATTAVCRQNSTPASAHISSQTTFMLSGS